MSRELIAARKLQALIAIGHSPDNLAAQLNLPAEYLIEIVKGNGWWSTLILNRIDNLYRRLELKPGSDEDSILLARRRRWAPPLVWDDIEDPDEVPDLSHLRPRRDSPIPPAEDLQELLNLGESFESLGRRFNCEEHSISRKIYRHRQLTQAEA